MQASIAIDVLFRKGSPYSTMRERSGLNSRYRFILFFGLDRIRATVTKFEI
jgi:hypothetical protein